MNNTALSGRLCREPEVRYGGKNGDVAIARFTLAVDDYKETDFINCRALGKSAEWVEKWCKKGTKVELVGKIKTGSYENRDGKKIYYTEVLANSLNFGETKTEAAGRGGQEQQSYEGDGFMNIPDDVDGELPFN